MTTTRAISGFKSYLTFYPKTSLVANSQYWLGESYYGQRKYREAIREFDRLIKDYPDSAKVPAAMLKKGNAYLELNEAAQGKRVLQELRAKFPNSGDARRAQDILQGLQ
jgi:tol-pal system protein YbgF